ADARCAALGAPFCTSVSKIQGVDATLNGPGLVMAHLVGGLDTPGGELISADARLLGLEAQEAGLPAIVANTPASLAEVLLSDHGSAVRGSVVTALIADGAGARSLREFPVGPRSEGAAPRILL